MLKLGTLIYGLDVNSSEYNCTGQFQNYKK